MKRKDVTDGELFVYAESSRHVFQAVPDEGWYLKNPKAQFTSSPKTACMESDVVLVGEEAAETGGKNAEVGADPASPAHYRAFTIEPIDAIESWGLNFRLANVIKYIARAGRKNESGDVRSHTSGGVLESEPTHSDPGAAAGRPGALDRAGPTRVDASTAARRRDLSKALRYLCREINAIDGRASWDYPAGPGGRG